MQTIYEANNFYTDFYLLSIFGSIFTLFALFGFGKSLDKTDMVFRLMCLIPGIFMLYLAFPYAKDYPAYQTKQYKITTGTLTDYWVTESAGSSDTTSTNTAHFIIEDTYFSLENGQYKVLAQLIDFELQVSYLPHSRKVIQIDIPLTKENLEKMKQLEND